MRGGGPPARPTLFVMVGLPASGKTTRARALEAEHGALRLTPDEWMIPLFGEPEAGGKRDVLEGRFVWLAVRALRAGVSVVLDLGVWGRDERSALRWFADQEGADCVLVHLPVEQDEQQRRVTARWAADPASTFPMSPEDLAAHRRAFEAPDEEELAAPRPAPPPPGHRTWASWAAQRWPTSTAGG